MMSSELLQETEEYRLGHESEVFNNTTLLESP
jgi:hypothetical protein